MATPVFDASTDIPQHVIGVKNSILSKSLRIVSTILEREKLAYKNQLVLVLNAYLDDTTVSKGWAIYGYDEPNDNWIKIHEQESMDVDLTNLCSKEEVEHMLVEHGTGMTWSQIQ